MCNELRAKNYVISIILMQFSLSGTQNLPIIMMNDMYFMGKYNHTKIASSYFFKFQIYMNCPLKISCN